jgi:Sulfotransferase family
MSFVSWVGRGLHRLPPSVLAILPPEQRADLRRRFGRYRAWESGFDLTPPSLRPGEASGPPDFVGVGVPMAMTRWWFRLIADHPGVYVRDDLGVARHYLSHFATGPFGPTEVQRYRSLFPRPPGTITGEWTPNYLGDPWVPPLLAEASPQARVLVMLRDPIVRLRMGLSRSIDHRRANAGSHMVNAVDRSFYAGPLRRFLQYFSTDQILVLQYERCIVEPLEQLGLTYRFLGLDDEHRPADVSPPIGEAALPPLDTDVTARLVDIYAADVAELMALAPLLDLSLWPDFD